jgi:hypothetical protein
MHDWLASKLTDHAGALCLLKGFKGKNVELVYGKIIFSSTSGRINGAGAFCPASAQRDQQAETHSFQGHQV